MALQSESAYRQTEISNNEAGKVKYPIITQFDILSELENLSVGDLLSLLKFI